jgi:hypothetical protein
MQSPRSWENRSKKTSGGSTEPNQAPEQAKRFFSYPTLPVHCQCQVPRGRRKRRVGSRSGSKNSNKSCTTCNLLATAGRKVRARTLVALLWIDRAVPAAGAKELRFFLSLLSSSDLRQSGEREEGRKSDNAFFGSLSPWLAFRRYGREGGREEGMLWSFSLRVFIDDDVGGGLVMRSGEERAAHSFFLWLPGGLSLRSSLARL